MHAQSMNLEQIPFSCSGSLSTEIGSKPGNPRGLNPAARDTVSRNALVLRQPWFDGHPGGTVQLCWAVVGHSHGPPAPDRAIHHRMRDAALGALMILLGTAATYGAPAPTAPTEGTPPATAPASAAAESVDAGLRDYYSANGLLNRGLHELAAVEYRKFLSAHPEHEKVPVARYGLAVCLYRLGQHAEAVAELKLLHASPDAPYPAESAAILGQCQLALGAYEEAAEAFTDILEHHRGHELADDAAAGAVEALYALQRYDEAATQARLLAARWPQSPLRARVEFFWGLAGMAQQDYAAAAEHFALIQDDHEQSAFAPQATLLLAQCYHHQSLLQQAARQYQRVVKQAESRFADEALFGLGMLALQKQEWDDSGQHFERLLQEHPQSPRAPAARFYRGRVHLEQGDLEAATRCFDQCRREQLEPELQDNLAFWSAKVLLRQQKLAEAARQLEEALTTYPDTELRAEMQYDRALALVQAGEVDAGIDSLTTFRTEYPAHEMAPDALHLLASTEHQRRHYDKSLAHCRTFLEQHHNHALTANVLFLAAENQYLAGSYADAASTYEQFLRAHPRDEQATQATYRLGCALYRLEQFDEAAPHLNAVEREARTTPEFAFALFALGDIHFQRAEWVPAEKYLHAYLAGGQDVPAADDALLKQGLALQRQRQHEQALQVYSTLLERFAESPHRLQALFESGQVLRALQRGAEARAAFEQVLALDPESRFAPFALKHLGALAMESGDYAGAAQLYGRAQNPDATSDAGGAEVLFNRGQALLAAGAYPEAEQSFRSFLEQNRGHERAGLAAAQLVIALARQDRHADALSTIKQVEHRSHRELPDYWQATVNYEQAWCLRQLGRIEEAAVVYRNLLEGKLEDELKAHTLLELAGLEIEAKNYKPAAGLLRDLGALLARAPDAWPEELPIQQTYQLGICESELGEFEDAGRLFEEFITLFPNSVLIASASFYCGEAYYQTGKPAQAITHLTRVVEQFSSDSTYGPSLLRLGECLASLQRWPRSEQVFTEYLKRFGDRDAWFQAQFGLGWARENQGRHDEAISAYRQVVEHHQGPTAARAQFQIGECLFARGRFEEAVRELLKVDILYAYPEWSAAALYEAGQCFEHLGKAVEARAQFQAVVDKHQDTRWAQLAASRLESLAGAAVPGR